MKILFSGLPAAGHLLPMTSLVRAARDSGHVVGVVSGPSAATWLPDVQLLVAGPSVKELLDETARRSDGDAMQPGQAAVEHFAGTRVDLTFDEGLEQARRFGPELIVSESVDFVGPLIAAALRIPWAVLGITGGMPAELAEGFSRRLQPQYDRRRLVPRPRLAYVDPYPDVLRVHGSPPVDDRIALRPVVLGDDTDEPAPALTLRPELPTVLVTLGTSVRDPEALRAATDAALRSGANVIVTAPPPAPGVPREDRAHAVGFTPLAVLLPLADVVLSAGGTGTVLAAAATATPMVIRPLHADQMWNADRVAAAGIGVAITDFAEATDALHEVQGAPSFARRAQSAARQIAQMSSPHEVLSALLSRM